MKYLFFSIVIIAAFSSSCRLDSFLYNPDEVTEYKFDDYDGELRFTIDPSYDIADSLVSLFTLESGGNKIYCVYVGDINRISQDTVILYCHGNAAHMDVYWPRAKLLANVGHKNRFGVMMMDYRGYGLSEGDPTEQGLYEDVDACMKWLQSKGLTDNRLVMYGFSLGTAPATELTANKRTLQPSKLILEAPFASGDFLTQDISKISLAGSFFHNLEIDNAVEITKVTEPFLWLHGVADSYIGIHHGEQVAKNYQGVYKVERRVEGGEHSTVPPVMGFDVYEQQILEFMEY